MTCLIFLRLLPTIVTDPKVIHLATGLSVNLTACQLHFLPCWLKGTGLSASSIWLVSNMVIQTVCDKQNVREMLVSYFIQPVCNCSRQACKLSSPVGNFSRLGPSVGNFYNRQAVNKSQQVCNTNRQAENCNR